MFIIYLMKHILFFLLLLILIYLYLNKPYFKNIGGKKRKRKRKRKRKQKKPDKNMCKKNPNNSKCKKYCKKNPNDSMCKIDCNNPKYKNTSNCRRYNNNTMINCTTSMASECTNKKRWPIDCNRNNHSECDMSYEQFPIDCSLGNYRNYRECKSYVDSNINTDIAVGSAVASGVAMNTVNNTNNIEEPFENKPQGAANMPEGPERDAAMKKEQEMKEKYASNQNIKIKKSSNQNALQRRLDKLIYENGKIFLTFLWFQRKYLPNPIEPKWTREIVWLPLDDDENFHIRTPFNSFNPSDPFGIWIPNRQELERLTDMMFAHSLPLPPLFLADITIIQLEIYAKWFKKYYIDKEYKQEDNIIVKKIKKFINSL